MLDWFQSHIKFIYWKLKDNKIRSCNIPAELLLQIYLPTKTSILTLMHLFCPWPISFSSWGWHFIPYKFKYSAQNWNNKTPLSNDKVTFILQPETHRKMSFIISIMEVEKCLDTVTSMTRLIVKKRRQAGRLIVRIVRGAPLLEVMVARVPGSEVSKIIIWILVPRLYKVS